MSNSKKLLNRKEALEKVRKWQASGKKVVFSNGCFDILHAGHVEYLSAAKALGDMLIIGLNSDASIRRLKGANRPVCCESDRASVLSALQMVDGVTIFNEDTPEELIGILLPDMLVKGSDWAIEQIAGAKAVLDHGGSVLTLPLLEGRSTTGIIEKIDPVGACIGQKGVRIQSVMNELNGERVDIIEWSKDPKEFIATALQPAKIADVIIVNAGEDPKVPKRAAVFVEEAERPMAIGKRGQNVRLASDLTGFELDLYNLEQLPAFKEKVKELVKTGHRIEDEELQSVEAVKELEAAEQSLKEEKETVPEKEEKEGSWGKLTKAVYSKLEAAGYKSLEDLKGKDLKALEEIEGIGKASAEKIMKEIE